MRYLCIVMVIGLIFTGCQTKPNNFQEMVEQLDKTERDIREKQDKIRQTVREYNAAHPGESRIDTTSIERMVLDPSQSETLNRMLKDEKDVSYRGLLTEVVDSQRYVRIRCFSNRLPVIKCI